MTPNRRAQPTVRADHLLVARGLAPSREKAQALILAGSVTAGGRRVEKPGHRLPHDAEIAVAPGRRFVGRGGDKLDGALSALEIDLAGRRVLDVGASTGGFTDCSLRRGASGVVALDVGRGQLDWSLRTDPRVVAIEGKNARYLEPADVPGPFDLVVVDVSFISLRLILPRLPSVLRAARSADQEDDPRAASDHPPVGPGSAAEAAIHLAAAPDASASPAVSVSDGESEPSFASPTAPAAASASAAAAASDSALSSASASSAAPARASATPTAVSGPAPLPAIVALVKPQFEVGPARVGAGGVVRDPAVQTDAVLDVARYAASALGLGVWRVLESSPRGAEGNREFFVCLVPGYDRAADDVEAEVRRVVGGEAPTDPRGIR